MQAYDPTASFTAFAADRCLASGPLVTVALTTRKFRLQDNETPVWVFDDRNGEQIELDLRGGEDEVAARLPATASVAVEPIAEPPASRGPGRPRLGVVAREVTLLPRHWEWLAAQPGGASVTLRKLVDAARRESAWQDAVCQAQLACDRFMLTMAGNRPGFEAASRALHAGDAATFREQIAAWPVDIRAHAARLALTAFETQSPVAA